MDHHLGGWSAPWAKRYMLLEEDEGLQFYKDDVALQMIFSIRLEDIEKVTLDAKLNDQFTVDLIKKKQYRFKVESSEIASKWVDSISIAKSNFDHPSRVEKRSSSSNSNSNSTPSSPLVNNNNNNDNNNINISGEREGFLETFVTGTVYTGVSSWIKRWYSIEGKILYCYSSNRKLHQHPLEKISLSKITAVIKSSSQDKKFTIKVLTQGQVLYLSAENEEDQNQWIHSLLLSSPLGKQLAFNDEDTSSYILSSATEGYVQRQSSSSSPSSPSPSPSFNNNNNNNLNKKLNWEKVWLSSAGLFLLYFTSEFATNPLEKYSVKNIKHVHAVDDSKTDFIIDFTDGKSILHRANSFNERNDWVDKLDFLRKQFVDIFDIFRISDREVESQDAVNRIEVCFFFINLILFIYFYFIN